jgi:hypothetical protein
VNDKIPPEDRSDISVDEDAVDDVTEEVSLATRILRFQELHQNLDTEIKELYEFPYRDQLLLQRLKKRKLRVKDTIEILKGDLIPDWNA